MQQTSNLINVIKSLVKLQVISIEIYNNKQKIHYIPKEIREQQSELVEIKEQYETSKDKNNKLTNEINEKNKKLLIIRDEIKKLKEKEKLVKTQKEFLALDTEVSMRKEKQEKLEKEVMHSTKLLNIQNKKVEKQKSKAEEAIDFLEEVEKDAQLEIEKLNHQIAELKEDREQITPDIDKPLLSVYDRIVKNKKGLGIVPILNGICQGCYISIPQSTINQVRRATAIVTCPNCARMFYLPEMLNGNKNIG